jgi:hypothetical protein
LSQGLGSRFGLGKRKRGGEVPGPCDDPPGERAAADTQKRSARLKCNGVVFSCGNYRGSGHLTRRVRPVGSFFPFKILFNFCNCMNVSMVVIGDPKKLDQIRGGFSAALSSDDFTATGTVARTSSRGFNLMIDAGAARAGQIHFLVVRLSDGLRAEGFVECTPGTRTCTEISASFPSTIAGRPLGKIEGVLHWDGSMGVLSATWSLPKG